MVKDAERVEMEVEESSVGISMAASSISVRYPVRLRATANL